MENFVVVIVVIVIGLVVLHPISALHVGELAVG